MAIPPTHDDGQAAWRHYRSLAARLVRDRDAIDEAAQELMIAALRQPPTNPRAAVAWARSVLRRIAARHHRSRARRTRHETDYARLMAPPATASGGADDDVIDRIAQACGGLSAADRQILDLRYRQDLPPRQIAARLDLPVRTVQSRLYRALVRLRSRVDRRRERRPRAIGWWRRTTGSRRAPLGALAAATLAGIGTLMTWPAGAPIRSPARNAGESTPGRESARAEGIERRAVDRPPADANASDGVTAVAAAFRGTAIDLGGRPAGALQLRFTERCPAGFINSEADAGPDPASIPISTAEDGTFATAAPPTSGWLLADDPRWVTVVAGVVSRLPPPHSTRVVVAKSRSLAGRVLDSRGIGIAAARVRLRLPAGWSLPLTEAEYAFTCEPETYSDSDGNFAWPRAPDLDGAVLEVDRGGYAPGQTTIGPGPQPAVQVVLTGIDSWSNRLVDEAGSPIGGAWVFCGGRRFASDADGKFSIPRPAAGDEVVVTAPGRAPLRWRGDALPVLSPLVAAQPSATIRGTVEATERGGQWMIWVRDLEVLAVVEGKPVTTEYAAVRHPPDGWPRTFNRPDGKFELRGLRSRQYRIRALDHVRMTLIDSGPVAAGTDAVVLTPGTEPTHPPIRGGIVDRHGAPVAGARVVRRRLVETMYDPVADTTHEFVIHGTEPAVTDADGNFRLLDLPAAEVGLVVMGEGVLTRSVAAATVARQLRDHGTLRVIVGRACNIAVAGTHADEFALLRADGTPHDLGVRQGSSADLVHRGRVAPAPPEYRASDLATELVLYRDHEEVGRMPLDLRPGITNTVHIDGAVPR